MIYDISMPRIIDTETGEMIEFADINLAEMSEKEKIHLLAAMKRHMNKMREINSMVESMAVHELYLKEATSYKDEELKINVQNKTEYAYDTELVDSLKEFITEEQFNAALKKQYKGNRTQLRSLMTLGGDIKKIIDKATIETPQKPYVKVEYLK